jgi:hypothetical protein
MLPEMARTVKENTKKRFFDGEACKHSPATLKSVFPSNKQIFRSNGVKLGKYSKYQQDVISRYYDNLDVIMLGKIQEMVTELYLADSEAKQKRLWERVGKAMKKLKVKPNIIEHAQKRCYHPCQKPGRLAEKIGHKKIISDFQPKNNTLSHKGRFFVFSA